MKSNGIMGYKCDAFHGEYDVGETPLISECSWSCSSKCIDFADLKYDRPTSHYCLYFATFRTTQKLLLLGKKFCRKIFTLFIYTYVCVYLCGKRNILMYLKNIFIEYLFVYFMKRRREKN